MHARTRTTVAIATGLLAAALVASPAVAATGDAAGRGAPATAQTTPDCDGTGPADGRGTGARSERGLRGTATAGADRAAVRLGMGGPGPGAGANGDLADVASGTLTIDQRSALAAMAEEEKVAHDLYASFSTIFDSARFGRIAEAENQHLTEIRLLLDRYDMTDPTAGLDAGRYATQSFQDLYDTKLASGSTDLAAAYTVAVGIETTDIADLTEAMTDVTAPDVLTIYTNLLAGSERHLSSLGG